jgi:DNA-binding protein HU-beta
MARSGPQMNRMSMNISELTERIAEDSALSKAEAKRLVEAVLKAIVDTAVAGGETSLPNFGKFKVSSRPAREGRNPATGATIQIAATRKLSFVAVKSVRDALNA